MEFTSIKRPRNVGWVRAAALLYGDWGTSKAYVIGIGFALAGYAALPHLLAVVLLTAIVGINYIWVCKCFPNGGGVYSAARVHSQKLAVLGALLLTADFVVTASLSCLEAFHYFGFPSEDARRIAIFAIIIIGIMNAYGPKFTGNLAIYLAFPTVVLIIVLLIFGVPHITFDHLQKPQGGILHNWMLFAGMILALSGVEAAASTTGVMQLDAGSTYERPQIARTATRAVMVVMIEVCVATALLAFLTLSTPGLEGGEYKEAMIRHLGEVYVGEWFGVAIGVVIALLLLSAVNTAINGIISVVYVMAHDGELPKTFTYLNGHGVPWLALILATALPVLVLEIARDVSMLASLYAIGVVGAITINLGSTAMNQSLSLKRYQRYFMGATAILLLLIWITIAVEKQSALVFILFFTVAGFIARGYALRKKSAESLDLVSANEEEWKTASLPGPEDTYEESGQSILVSVRGVTPALKFAVEEARLRRARLYVLYIKEVAVQVQIHPRWQDDADASKVFKEISQIAKGVPLVPLFAFGFNPAELILDTSATLGVDILILGGSARNSLLKILRGNVVEEVTRNLPENIQLIIYS